ncbi:putative nuclease HARBI1 isoform X1 [Bactrocera dorsalis]|uniref:Nuclease HARBI1 isoform X1 n=1 Tax=Bactrocera dorsalis TaxID=27457 RepID=A0ABM3IYB4_BACDO|nr:putative nuclease HARBI1 isoform X1 [Bactrocera dorsalis]
MNPNVFFYSSSSESDEEHQQMAIRSRIRDKSNPLALPEAAFRKRFRLTKDAFTFILSEIEFNGHLSTAVPPILQLAATLSLLASGGYQHSVGNDFLIGMCQSTVCKIVGDVVNEMETKLCPHFIKFSPNRLSKCTEYFVEKYKVPGVIGCIDGTHFGLQKPTVNEHMFFNRKGYHSLNSMIICDYEHRILAIDSKYGGAAHDSFVWKHSAQRRFLEEAYNQNNMRNVWLLGNICTYTAAKYIYKHIYVFSQLTGDSGYPLEPWCLTPFRNPEVGSCQARFNEIHAKARCIVERTIGILKGRWKILTNDKRSRYSPEKMAKFGNVCAALHNICIQCKNSTYCRYFVNENNDTEIDTGNETQLTKIGHKIRDHIMLSLDNN